MRLAPGVQPYPSISERPANDPSFNTAQTVVCRGFALTLTDDLALLAVVLSFASLIATVFLTLRLSKSEIDNNIMLAVDSTLSLLEKAKTLSVEERRLLAAVLRDWDYFNPPSFIGARKGSKPSEETIKALATYFDQLGRASPETNE